MRYYVFLCCLLTTSPSMAMDPEEYSHPSSLLQPSSSAGSSLDSLQSSDDENGLVHHSTITRRDNSKRTERQGEASIQSATLSPMPYDSLSQSSSSSSSNVPMTPQEESDFESLKQAAANGEATVQDRATAQARLGAMYMNGQVAGGKCPENDVEAVKWLKLAAENDNWLKLAQENDNELAQIIKFAQISLAKMYAGCRGVKGKLPENCVKVANLLRQAVDNGLPEIRYHETLYDLGNMYATGRVSGGKSPENNRIAIQWYKLTAKEGYGPAQFQLGVVYASREVPGKTPSECDEKAYMWLELAAKNGNEFEELYLKVMYRRK